MNPNFRMGPPFKVIVIREFDLGVITQDQDGKEYQLRYPEMNAELQSLYESERISTSIGLEFEVRAYVELPGRVSLRNESQMRARWQETLSKCEPKLK
jgi:hypothetical protein